MESPGAVGRRRGNSRSNAEDQALDQIAREVSGKSVFFSFNLIAEMQNYRRCNEMKIQLF